MRLAARQEFETNYTAKVNHDRLLTIYRAAPGDAASIRMIQQKRYERRAGLPSFRYL